MEYKGDLDHLIWKETKQNGEKAKITVAVRSYDQGEPKVAITREITLKSGMVITKKSGRMTGQEWEWVLSKSAEIAIALKGV